MAFAQPLRIKLLERFAPILFLHKDEPNFPVSPIQYVERAALWASTPPKHPKMDWGLPSGAARQPLVPHGGLSLNPAHDVGGASDPDNDGVPEHYLGEQGRLAYPYLNPQGRELWLDLAGWHDGKAVAATTVNQRTPLTPRPPMRQPCYMGEVWTLQEWRDQIGPDEFLRHFGLAPDQHPETLAQLAIVSYYLLFPLHRQARPKTSKSAADDPTTGNYEGDWTSFAVITRVRAAGRRDEPAIDDFEPLFGAFGHRWRGASRDFEEWTRNRMALRPWTALATVNDHAVIQAAHGTHNLYPHDPPAGNGTGTIKPQEGFGDSLSGAGDDFVQDAVEQPGSAGLAAATIAKIAAGLAFFGIFGAIVGGIAAAAEAEVAGEEGIVEVPDIGGGSGGGDEGDVDAEETDSDESGLSTQSRVAVPPDVTAPPFAGAGADVRPWSLSPAESLGELAAPLLFPAAPDGLRFEGRWGVRVVDDWELRRGGIRFPRHWHQIVDALLKNT